MFKKLFALSFICLFYFSAFSQQLKDDQTRLNNGEDLNVMYRNESSFGIYGHTAGGIGLSYRRGWHVTGKRKSMVELEAQNFKHPKEIKSVNSSYENAKGFVYGKLNSIFIIRPGFGFQNIIYQKNDVSRDKKNVEIRCAYFLGVALAFAKPVYLEIIHPNNDPTRPDKYTISEERYDPNKHFPEDIYGKASFFRGIDHMTIYPGGYAKLALSFEYGDRYNKIKAIEVGSVVDVYPRVIPMMAFSKNQQVFVNLYLKFVFGKKWF